MYTDIDINRKYLPTATSGSPCGGAESRSPGPTRRRTREPLAIRVREFRVLGFLEFRVLGFRV